MRVLLQICLFVTLLAVSAGAAAKPTKGLRYPSLSPDGKQVAFCYRGDVWIAPTDGKGRPQRLTLHEAQETLERARDQMQIEWGQLQVEASTWAAQDRIESLAGDKLDLRVPASTVEASGSAALWITCR